MGDDSTRRGDSHLTVYVAWPILAGVGLGAVLSVSVGGVVLLVTRLDWRTAGIWTAGTFFVTLGVTTVGVFLYALNEWSGPRRAERLARLDREVVEVDAPEPEPRFIRLSSKRPLKYEPPPMPTTEQERRGVLASTIGVLADRLGRTATVTTYEQAAQTIEPEAPPWIREMYTVLCASWPDHLTRREWSSMFDGGTMLWSKYINGDGSGRHARRGILDTWGAIERQDGRGSWRYCHDLETIFGLDPELKAYAEARSGLVQHSPDKRSRPENASLQATKPIRTDDRTENRKEGEG